MYRLKLNYKFRQLHLAKKSEKLPMKSVVIEQMGELPTVRKVLPYRAETVKKVAQLLRHLVVLHHLLAPRRLVNEQVLVAWWFGIVLLLVVAWVFERVPYPVNDGLPLELLRQSHQPQLEQLRA